MTDIGSHGEWFLILGPKGRHFGTTPSFIVIIAPSALARLYGFGSTPLRAWLLHAGPSGLRLLSNWHQGVGRFFPSCLSTKPFL